MEEMLQKMTDHPAKSFVFGAFITIAIQSSSALTVMLVGLVNSGIMNLSQMNPWHMQGPRQWGLSWVLMLERH